MKDVDIKNITHINKKIPETLNECNDIDCYHCAYCKYYPLSVNLHILCVHRKLLNDII